VSIRNDLRFIVNKESAFSNLSQITPTCRKRSLPTVEYQTPAFWPNIFSAHRVSILIHTFHYLWSQNELGQSPEKWRAACIFKRSLKVVRFENSEIIYMWSWMESRVLPPGCTVEENTTFMKICRENTHFIKSGKNARDFTWRPKHVSLLLETPNRWADIRLLVRPSVRLSARISRAPNERISAKFHEDFNGNLSRKSKFG